MYTSFFFSFLTHRSLQSLRREKELKSDLLQFYISPHSRNFSILSSIRLPHGSKSTAATVQEGRSHPKVHDRSVRSSNVLVPKKCDVQPGACRPGGLGTAPTRLGHARQHRSVSPMKDKGLFLRCMRVRVCTTHTRAVVLLSNVRRVIRKKKKKKKKKASAHLKSNFFIPAGNCRQRAKPKYLCCRTATRPHAHARGTRTPAHLHTIRIHAASCLFHPPLLHPSAFHPRGSLRKKSYLVPESQLRAIKCGSSGTEGRARARTHRHTHAPPF